MVLQLKKVRIESGLSLERIARDLNIRERYLIAIEEGNLSELPAKVYANGYMKLYANYLGVNLSSNLISDIKQPKIVDEKLHFNFKLKKYLIITSILILIIISAIYYFIDTDTNDVVSIIEIPNQANVINDNNKSR